MRQPSSESEFDALLAEAGKKTVIIDFTATWCGPCQRIAPLFASLEEEFKHVVFCKVDVDENGGIAERYNVSAMPTFKALRAGAVVGELQGADPDALRKLVETNQGDSWEGVGEGQALGGSGAAGGSEKEKRLAALAARGL